MTSSGVMVSQGSSGVHMTSAARRESLPTTSDPTDDRLLRRLAMSLASGIFRPWRQRMRVMTAEVALPMSSSLPSPSLASDLSLPRTRLMVSRSILARSLSDIWLKVASASSSSSTSTLSIFALIQSPSLRSSASATSDTIEARESSSSVSTSSASLAMTPSTEFGPLSGQFVATCTLHTDSASSSSCPHPPKSDVAMNSMLPTSTSEPNEGPNSIGAPYPYEE
mmetsp:Transcript_21775/g.50539  ORF Transcript_21775/g.50539 Transcript_21775/m.50539 type:complete len:224 (+) Transcript_21775:338-1009(+)